MEPTSPRPPVLDNATSMKSKLLKKRKSQLLISQPIHHQDCIESDPSATSLDSMPPARKKSRMSECNGMTTSRSSSHPRRIYPTLLPMQSESEILSAYREESVINFSCIGYDSLVKYCQMFNLHDFRYNIHYDLAHRSSAKFDEVLRQSEQAKKLKRNAEKSQQSQQQSSDAAADSARISGSNSARKRVSYADTAGTNQSKRSKQKGHKKRSKQKKKSRKDENENDNDASSGDSVKKETEHHYFNSEQLDVHYEKPESTEDEIPRTFDSASKLSKTELVNVVRQHFLSTPLLADMSEMDVVRQFLFFIQNRRKRLRKEFRFQ